MYIEAWDDEIQSSSVSGIDGDISTAQEAFHIALWDSAVSFYEDLAPCRFGLIVAHVVQPTLIMCQTHVAVYVITIVSYTHAQSASNSTLNIAVR